MERSAIGCCVLLVCLLVTPAPLRSQSAAIGAYDLSTGQGACAVSVPANGFVIIQIRLVNALAPVKTAKFKVLPSVPLASIPAGGENFDLSFASCVSTGEAIAAVVAANGATPVTCNFDIVPATGETDIVLTDCSGYTLYGRDAIGWGVDPCEDVGGWTAPYRPIPANGATGVSTHTTLGFELGDATDVAMATDPALVSFDNPICSASPWDPPGVPDCTPPIDPGPLQPNTTYYWRAGVFCWGCYHGEGAISPLFSFTTAGTTASEQLTWGAVKAMYRK